MIRWPPKWNAESVRVCKVNAVQIQAIFVGLLSLSGAATWVVTRRHNETIETGDSSSRATTAIADAAETLVAPLTAELRRVSAACAQHQEQIDRLSRHVNVLQQQVIELGAEPAVSP